MWHDERFRALSAPQPNAQTLWIWLLTSPRTTTFPGLVIAHEEAIAADLGWSLEDFREAFGEAFAKGMVKADWKAGVVVLTKALRDGFGEPRETAKPQAPNVIRGWAKSWEMVPECELSREYLGELEAFVKALPKAFQDAFADAFRKAIAKGFAKPSPIQETGDRNQESGERGLSPRARAIPRGTPPPTEPPPAPSGAPSPDPRIKINHDAWSYAASKHAELRAAGIEPDARPWPALPLGIAADDLVARTRELAALDPDAIRKAHMHRVDVAAAEARDKRHLKWFTPSRMWARESWWKGYEGTPSQAERKAPQPATDAPKLFVPPGASLDDYEPDLRPYSEIEAARKAR